MGNKKEIKITKEMQEKYQKGQQLFLRRTTSFRSRYVFFPYSTFIGCGILKKPATHLIENVNNILLYAYGLNRDGTDIEETINHEMTLVELMTFKKLIDDIFNMLKIKTFDLEKGFQEQKNKLEKEVNFKFEEEL